MMQANRPLHLLSVSQFAFSGLALLGTLGLGLTTALVALSGQADGTLAPGDFAALMLRTAGLVLAAVLVLPSLGLSLARLVGWSRLNPEFPGLASGRIGLALAAGVALLWVLAWLSSASVFQLAGGWAILLQPPVYLLVAALPVAFWLMLGIHGLRGGSAQRLWGAFTASLAGGTLLILVVEAVILVAVVLLIAALIASRPDWLAEMNRLLSRLSNSAGNLDQMTRLLTPYLSRPWVMIVGSALFCAAIPLVEELFKPLPVLLLLRRRLTPAEGFAAGLACGAGFAFFESLGMLSAVTGTSWPALSAGRAGTDLLHITTSGLIGWALASTWLDGRGARLAVSILAGTALHGTWNLVSLASSLLTELPSVPAWLQPLQHPAVGPLGLGGIALVLLAILLGLNWRLRSRSGMNRVESNLTTGG